MTAAFVTQHAIYICAVRVTARMQSVRSDVVVAHYAIISENLCRVCDLQSAIQTCDLLHERVFLLIYVFAWYIVIVD